LDFYIVIPARNEEDSIAQSLESLTQQTLLPKKIVVVNDNSTDGTQKIIESYVDKYEFISLVNSQSSNKHLPGAKIINAFYTGFETLDSNYDVICKFDADLIFPENYIERLALHFNTHEALGMVSGFCYIEKNSQWVLENLTNKDHIRGALKAYRKQCFEDIGQLKRSIGWDTIDELLAKYYHWELKTDISLQVKHLKPTGASYNVAAKYSQGEAMYKMRLGYTLTCITGLKMCLKKKSLRPIQNYIFGYLKANFDSTTFLVTQDQGKFFRTLRWRGIKNIVFKQNV
jgi:glycosyltransferase involved in cell wall biosynthesis